MACQASTGKEYLLTMMHGIECNCSGFWPFNFNSDPLTPSTWAPGVVPPIPSMGSSRREGDNEKQQEYMADTDNTCLHKTILWWGRFDKDYSRNRIIRHLMHELGCRIVDFHPRVSALGDLEARFKGMQKPDLVWVPCFRQRDVHAACRWARSQAVPLVFDPLISAWDKQVYERHKFSPESKAAIKLLKQEQDQFHKADTLIADTDEHAHFFSDTFHVDRDRIKLIPVGAEESLFKPEPIPVSRTGPAQVLFYGSFINLQGPQVIIEAARLCAGRAIRWHLLGKGPLLESCKKAAQGLDNCVFEDWIEYRTLADRIHQADILLGIFGSSEKSGRVIPNKVYQALACARPVITRNSTSYPDTIANGMQSGIFQVPAANPQALADVVSHVADSREHIITAGLNARKTYEAYFSNAMIKEKLKTLLTTMNE